MSVTLNVTVDPNEWLQWGAIIVLLLFVALHTHPTYWGRR